MNDSMDSELRDRSALVLYGSETGNASDYAEEIGGMTERLHFSTHVSSLDAVEPISLHRYSLVVIVISTTGQGDLPINARQFWKNVLRRKLPPTYLNDVQFTTFGLGDSSYPRFNWAARKLHKRLVQLGANELYPRGEADDQHEEGSDASFVPWSNDFRRHILKSFPLENGLKPIPDEASLDPKWTLETVERYQTIPNGLISTEGTPPVAQASTCAGVECSTNSQSGNSPLGAGRRFVATLDENVRVTAEAHWQDVRRLVFSTPVSTPYEPGDVLTIYPRNAPEDVDQLLRAMDWNHVAERPVRLVPTASNRRRSGFQFQALPISSTASTMTFRSLLTDHLDLSAIPKRSFFSIIAHFAEDQSQRERLREFTKPEYIDELYDYTTRPRRSILEVLQEFGTVKFPWQWAANVLPELRGRQFSIASGGTLKADLNGSTRFELLAAIVKYKTVIKKVRQGVCTRYLADLPIGSRLDVTLQKGSLGITQAQAKRPIILVGPGTGIAPMRSLIWERLQWTDSSTPQQLQMNGDNVVCDQRNLGEMVLFFGCRKKEADYFYREEWEQLQQQSHLKVFTAFSRDQKHKIYVQDLIKEQRELVYRLIHDSRALVYVCGSSGKMPKAVRVALTEALTKCGNMHQGDAEAYLQGMEKEGRYKQETW